MIKRTTIVTASLVALFALGVVLSGCPDDKKGAAGAASASAAVSAAPANTASAKTGSSGSGW